MVSPVDRAAGWTSTALLALSLISGRAAAAEGSIASPSLDRTGELPPALTATNTLLQGRFQKLLPVLDLALELRAREKGQRYFSKEEAEKFSDSILSAWKGALRTNGISVTDFPDGPREQQLFTYESLKLGIFCRAGFSKLQQPKDAFVGRIALGMATPLELDPTIVQRIELGKAVSKVSTYSVANLDLPGLSPFIATTIYGEVDGGYAIVVNQNAFTKLVHKTFKPQSKNEEDRLRKSALDLVILNEYSSVILGDYFKAKGGPSPTSIARIKLSADSDATIYAVELYEAYSDYCSLKYSDLPAWAYLLLFQDQGKQALPVSYAFTQALQKEAIVAAVTDIAPLQKALQERPRANGSEVITLTDICEVLRASPQLDSAFKNFMVAHMGKQVLGLIEAQTKH